MKLVFIPKNEQPFERRCRCRVGRSTVWNCTVAPFINAGGPTFSNAMNTLAKRLRRANGDIMQPVLAHVP